MLIKIKPNFYCAPEGEAAGGGGGGAPAAPAPASTPAASPAPSGLTAAERAFDNHPAFAKPGASPAPGANPNPTAGTPAADGAVPGAAPAAPTGGEPASTQVTQPTGPSARETQLESDLRARDALIANFQRQPQGQPNGQPPGQPNGQPADPTPQYQYSIPAQIIQGMASEDPNERGAAVSGLVSMALRTVHRTIMEDIGRQMMDLRNNQLPGMLNNFSNHQQQSKAVYDDFYGTYADLNDPNIMPLTMSVAQNLIKSGQFNGAWTPQFKLAVAQGVYKTLGRAMPGAGAPPAAGNPQPPVLAGGNNARPNMAPPAQSGGMAAEVNALWS